MYNENANFHNGQVAERVYTIDQLKEALTRPTTLGSNASDKAMWMGASNTELNATNSGIAGQATIQLVQGVEYSIQLDSTIDRYMKAAIDEAEQVAVAAINEAITGISQRRIAYGDVSTVLTAAAAAASINALEAKYRGEGVTIVFKMADGTKFNDGSVEWDFKYGGTIDAVIGAAGAVAFAPSPDNVDDQLNANDEQRLADVEAKSSQNEQSITALENANADLVAADALYQSFDNGQRPLSDLGKTSTVITAGLTLGISGTNVLLGATGIADGEVAILVDTQGNKPFRATGTALNGVVTIDNTLNSFDYILAETPTKVTVLAGSVETADDVKTYVDNNFDTSTVVDQKVLTAKNEAIADATTKANTAKSEAITAAGLAADGKIDTAITAERENFNWIAYQGSVTFGTQVGLNYQDINYSGGTLQDFLNNFSTTDQYKTSGDLSSFVQTYGLTSLNWQNLGLKVQIANADNTGNEWLQIGALVKYDIVTNTFDDLTLFDGFFAFFKATDYGHNTNSSAAIGTILASLGYGDREVKKLRFYPEQDWHNDLQEVQIADKEPKKTTQDFTVVNGQGQGVNYPTVAAGVQSRPVFINTALTFETIEVKLFKDAKTTFLGNLPFSKTTDENGAYTGIQIDYSADVDLSAGAIISITGR